MTSERIVDDAEGILTDFVETLVLPRVGECLPCYVSRMLEEFDCHCPSGLKFALLYRELQGLSTATMVQRLKQLRATCDCGILRWGWVLDERIVPRMSCEEMDAYYADPNRPPLYVCRGVERGSIKPCSGWLRPPWAV